MNAPTARQRVVLEALHAGKTIREIATALAITSTHGVQCHIAALAMKGLVTARKDEGRWGRYVLTADGLAALGLRQCGACCGAGVVSADFASGRAGATVGRVGRSR